ncbi:unnamed protein product [Onchocerca flexuosa]|uniref:Ovule protein n=1 Tax=Onchocerca flexuosa TaxID=387005 RepID=A0A183HEH3_9BILA|nr:unnamed protein product [Onchocerca flexuosa]
MQIGCGADVGYFFFMQVLRISVYVSLNHQIDDGLCKIKLQKPPVLNFLTIFHLILMIILFGRSLYFHQYFCSVSIPIINFIGNGTKYHALVLCKITKFHSPDPVSKEL